MRVPSTTSTHLRRLAQTLCVVLMAATPALSGCNNEQRARHDIQHLYGPDDKNFFRAMGHLLGRGIEQGNRFKALHNGDEIFPAMLAAIAAAQHTITFESYIYWSGQTGKAFSDALAERALKGVRVHLLIDWLGSSKIDADALANMERAGVEIRKYHPLRWYHWDRMNNRTHRKILVVDGRIGFTGGVGIADQWTGNAQDPEHWRDSHFQVEGPVVAQMQAVFMDNWIKVSGRVLHGEAYFPALAPVGAGAAQMFSSSPSGGSEHMRLMYLLAITAAERSIHLSSSYFVPDEMTRDALVAASRRGVKVQIITPGAHMDAETVRRASRSVWGELLQEGVEIHEYEPTMYHCKMLIVDSRFVTVGSTNFDPRSFSINDEANLNIYDRAFAEQQIAVFAQDLAKSRRVTFEAWKDRPWTEKLIEQAAGVFSSQL